MLVRDFIEHLEHIKRLYSSSGARRQADAIEAIVDALSAHLDRSLEAYVSLIAARPLARTRRTSQGTTQNAALIESYVTEFKTAASDKNQFHSILERLTRDRGVNARTLTAIVNSVSGHEGTFRNKAAAYDWLTTNFTDQLRFQRKLHPVQ